LIQHCDVVKTTFDYCSHGGAANLCKPTAYHFVLKRYHYRHRHHHHYYLHQSAWYWL